ncbi:hypothetical protein [Pararhodonellum marinum]|uniref:hypothetical protein n=1 Tax=Pararhodonellum marinum TaxID=2755358 RepID=UPI00188F211A|nr:hypothetical protein [Pararhodonellum marinum]
MKDLKTMSQKLPHEANALHQLSQFPLMKAIFGRRSRRFGRGMQIPSGPLAYRSKLEPLPLSELEQSILIAVGTGVTGWNFGVPFGPDRPKEHAHYTQRFTGRTAPTAGGFGTPALLYTDDKGTYITNTRDIQPNAISELGDDLSDAAERIIAVCKENTTQLSDHRLDLPAEPPHMLEPNLWMANAPGSTLLMPIGDASESVLSLMAMAISNGNVLMDDDAGKPVGNLEPFIKSGLLSKEKRVPLSILHQMAYEGCCMELAFMGHNMVLTQQAMGLGGLYFSGLNRWSILGAFADKGIQGMGFRFVRDDRWIMPNPVGLDGIYEGLCPPYYPDMRAAVEEFVSRKFGSKGAYHQDTPGPWKESKAIKRQMSPYSEEFVDCLTEVAQYIFDKHGKFPGTFTTLVMPGYVQAVHLDTDYYDAFYQTGAYLNSHAEHSRVWDGET